VFQLVHPDLKKKSTGSELPAKAKRPKKKKEVDESLETSGEQLDAPDMVRTTDGDATT
jgi:hypothetical protein